METTGKTCPIPCHVLDSGQPLWPEKLEGCGMLMGINALVKHGFTVIHSNGTQVEHNTKVTKVNTVAVKAVKVVLKRMIHWKPHQTKIIKGDLEKMQQLLQEFS